MRKIFALTVVAAAMLSQPASAGILDGVHILNISNIFESSMSDVNMTDARSTLVSQGAVVTDVAIGSFSAASLVGINIVYSGLVQNGYTAGQVATINSFVTGGGGLVSVGTERACCFGPQFEQLANSFGLTGLGGDRDAQLTATTPSSPIVDGPFGVANSYRPAATGAFNPNSLPGGTTVVWSGLDGNPIIVTLAVSGRAFFFGDTNFMENGYIAQADNRTIWGNAFAYTGRISDPPGGVPEPATWALMLGGFGLVGTALRRRRVATFA